MFETGLLRGKRILVTGGGSGLGAAMGRRFLALGAELVICGRKLDRLEATAAEMRAQTSGKVTTIACDIRDGAAVESMMDAIWREAPRTFRQPRSLLPGRSKACCSTARTRQCWCASRDRTRRSG